MKAGDVVIQKGVPIPPRGQTGMTNTLRKMAVGDSFQTGKEMLQSIRQSARVAGIKVETRTINNIGHVWKTGTLSKKTAKKTARKPAEGAPK